MKEIKIIKYCDFCETQENVQSYAFDINGPDMTASGEIDICSGCYTGASILSLVTTVIKHGQPIEKKSSLQTQPNVREVCPYCDNGKTYRRVAQHIAVMHPEHARK